ncbi:hypothetical protein J6590_013092 [Homalodisca vitripennis]|nr:hypothetical protein J6590_013092 [Homalodisca vitripennis]
MSSVTVQATVKMACKNDVINIALANFSDLSGSILWPSHPPLPTPPSHWFQLKLMNQVQFTMDLRI